MATINLSLIFSHPDAVSHFVQYARIDNVNTPVFSTVVPNPVTSPATIATNVPAGQYQINSTPVYADGRKCDPTVFTTPGCDPLTAISARLQAGNLIVSYSAPATAPKVRITVSYPNGGSNIANYVNNGVDIVIPIPAGLFGQFLVQGQSVCDESTGFYSGLSSTASVNILQPVAGTYSAGADSSTVCNNAPQTFYTNGPFIQGATLFTDSALSNIATGYNFIVFNGSIYAVDPTTGIIGAATGNTCGATISGLTTMLNVHPTSSGIISAPAGATVHVQLSANGNPSATVGLTVNIGAPLNLVYSTSNGINTFIFIMPAAGQVTWSGSWSSTDGSGAGTITVS